MTSPTDKEMAAFIHGIMSGLGAATAAKLLGLGFDEVCEMLTEIESELGIPHAVADMHPCFKKIEQTKAWRSRMEKGN